MKRAWSTIGLLTLAVAAVLQLQAQMEPRKPEPEIKKLVYFEGTWTLDGNMKPGPMGPGGKMTMTNKCKWMEGGFFLECHGEFKSNNMGSGTNVSYTTWDPNEKKYTYDEFNSTGEVVHSPGTVAGDTWTYTSDVKMGPQTIKGRWSMKITSPSSYDFKWEMSQDGSKWETAMEGKATKG